MDELKRLKIVELQELLKKRGLSIQHRIKQDLVDRLYAALCNESNSDLERNLMNESDDFSRDSDSDNLSESTVIGISENTFEKVYENLYNTEVGKEITDSSLETVERTPNDFEIDSSVEDEFVKNGRGKKKSEVTIQEDNQHVISKMPDESNFSFRDIEQSLESFNGETGKDVTVWVKEYEDVAAMCHWNDIQKYLYARRLLKGAARLAIEAETNIHNWKDLKDSLLKEFSKVTRSINLHKTLENRKKLPNESYLEYVYAMKRIACEGTIDEESIVIYIIEGIQDDASNKAILYDARTIAELKVKLRAYETMKSQKSSKIQTKLVPKANATRKPSSSKGRCGTCGAYSHVSNDCPHKAKGTRCFNCSEFGHISSKCPKRLRETEQKMSQVNPISLPHSHVVVTINSRNLIALVDTGSDITLIRKSIYLSLPKMAKDEGPSIVLTGFGQNVKMTICSFQLQMSLNGEDYEVRCHVVPDEWLSQDVLLGKDLLKDTTLLIENGKVTIHKNLSQNADRNMSSFLQQIDVMALVKENTSLTDVDIPNDYLRSEIQKLITDYDPKSPPESCIQMHIVLDDETPVYHKPRRLGPKEKQIVSEQIQQWLSDGIIQSSYSDFASPVVLAKKKDGSYRLCIDFRKLNKKIIKDRYPLPVMEEILEDLYAARVFTTLDLRNGFFHVDIDKPSQKYTAFVTSEGQFEFLKAPFGLCNSPAVFQRFINTLFQELIRNKVLLVYMDDIIIPSIDESTNIEKLKLVLEVAQRNGLIIKWSKCKFLSRKVEFLGHIIEDGCVKPSAEKTNAVRKFPLPKSVKDIRSFLGLTGFFRKFIANYAILARPLTDLTKTGTPFHFGDKEMTAFKQLKECLCQEPVLKLFDPSLETELHTDASKAGFGAVLLQKHIYEKFHPVFFLSFKTTKFEENYSSYELEVLAIIRALSRLRSYLLGLTFKIFTDCRAFQLTMKKKELCGRVARWALILEEYDCSVHHRSGTAMRHVDSLSRYPAILTIEEGLLHRIRKAQEKDETCRLIANLLKYDQYEDFILRNDILYKFDDGNYMLVLPKSMQWEIIRTVHERGHIHARKVQDIIKKDYYVPELAKRVQRVISNCVPCILVSKKEGKPEGILNPIEKVDSPLHTYHIDHLGPLASTAKNYKYLLVVVDAFTKFSWIYPVKDTSSCEVLKRLQLQSEIFGNPWRLISDRGTAFTSSAFKSYCEENSINHVLVTTGVPRGNGQVERLNRVIIAILAKMSVAEPEKWYKHVPKLQRLLNSIKTRATNKTPFELMIGVPMRNREDLELSQLIEDAIIEDFGDQRIEMRKCAKDAITRIQTENRKYSLRRRKKAREYQLRDLVAVKKTQFSSGTKLHPKFMGPYEVVRVKGKDRYDLKKVGNSEGPNVTTSAADNMKPWRDVDDDESSGADD